MSILPCLLPGLTAGKWNRLAERIACALPAEVRHKLAEWAALKEIGPPALFAVHEAFWTQQNLEKAQ